MSVVVARRRMASMNDEAGDFMPPPAFQGRIDLDPKLGDLAVNGVGNLTEGVGPPHRRYAVRVIHGFDVHAALALPEQAAEFAPGLPELGQLEASVKRVGKKPEGEAPRWIEAIAPGQPK